MESKANLKIEELNKEFQQLIEYVTDEASLSRTAHEVELGLFRNLMKLGNDMLGLFFFEERRFFLASLSKRRMVRY